MAAAADRGPSGEAPEVYRRLPLSVRRTSSEEETPEQVLA